eukprot:CAMPEP_0182862692 /NCGR_PEP_ID=MMETSP0034_2-20130328/6212_1 /TAXON_ID=156128 /ORGANISM="Nephroselmis pyriformis, Strain CCMP717" /LENGTH=304 /DNA_ID=CAMNT_0024994793 /DNA_START=814 /DNA_END=1728 /DNA_ORIENTATION=-
MNSVQYVDLSNSDILQNVLKRWWWWNASKDALSADHKNVFAHWNLIAARKRHDFALVAGSGHSVGNISKEESNFLQEKFDVFSNNFFLAHPFLVPDFHHLEFPRDFFSYQIDNGAAEFFAKVFDANRNRDTFFIAKYQTFRLQLQQAFRLKQPMKNLFTYMPSDVIYGDRRCSLSSGMYNPHPTKLRVSCAASLSIILDLVLKLKYKFVVFIGVDLGSKGHFYDNYTYLDPWRVVKKERKSQLKKYGNVHQTKKQNIDLFIKGVKTQHAQAMQVINLSNSSYLQKFLPTMKVSSLESTLSIENV